MDVADSISAYNVVFLATIAGFSVRALVAYLSSPWRKLPPGPRGLPILGNVFQMTSQPWKTFTNMQKQFGDLMCLNMAGQPMVIISSHRVATDLLERRASIYSDRPRNIVASDLMTSGLMIGMARYTNVWRRLRRASHEGLHRGVVHRFHPIQHLEGVLLALGFLEEPDNWDGHLQRAAASAIMSIVYGEPPIVSGNDGSVRAINDFVARVTRAALPGAHLVEFFPWMMYLPRILSPWRRKAEASYVADSAMFEGLVRNVEERMQDGDDRPSLTKTLLQTAERHGLSERETCWVAGTMYSAGAETTSTTMAWWMLAMVIYPETQKRAQEELDAIVGRDRLPAFADLENLPYIRAMAKEALRWRPIGPLGVPHCSIQDDWYDGYFIPAGTIIVPNVWHIQRDPGVYGDDAEHFNPARHLNEHGRVASGSTADARDEGRFAYGFGRRICVGRHVANNSLFIHIAMILWATHIERATDARGVPLPIDVDGCVEEGLAVRPVPFKVNITPRFPDAAMLLEVERESHGLAPFKSASNGVSMAR